MTVIERRLWIQRVNGLRGNILHVARSLKEDSQLGLTGRYLGGTCGRRSSGMLGQRLAIRPGGELQLGVGFAVVGYWHARKLASAPAATTPQAVAASVPSADTLRACGPDDRRDRRRRSWRPQGNRLRDEHGRQIGVRLLETDAPDPTRLTPAPAMAPSFAIATC